MPSWYCHSEATLTGLRVRRLATRAAQSCLRTCFAVLALCACALSAMAADNGLVVRCGATDPVPLRPYLSVFRDPTGQLDLAAIRARDSQFESLPAGSGLNLSYTADTVWLRLRIRSACVETESRFVEFDYASLDHAVLFLDADVVQQAGDRVPFSERPFQHRNPLFSVTLAPGADRVLYWRVRSEGSLTINPTLWPPLAFTRHSQHAYAAHAFYFGMLLALAAYNLLLFTVLRERVYLLYVGFVLAVGIGIASIYGLAAEFLWPEWVDWSNRALIISFAFSGVVGPLFTRDFLGTAHAAPGWHRWLGVAAAAHVGMMLVGVFAPMRLGMQLMSLSTIVNCALMWGGGVVCLRRRVPGARLFVLSWAILLLGGILMGLRNFGLLPTNAATLYAMEIGSALEMLLLSFALAARFERIKQERAAAQADALHAQRALVSSLQQQERELEQRVTERTEALAAANARLQSLAALDPLTGLGNRTALYGWLNDLLADRDRRFSLLLVDLDGFKAVNDQLGHAAGDQLLIELSERWHAGLRQGERLARLGGDEFVLISELAAGQDSAEAVAATLRAALKAPMRAAPGASIDASIGVALRQADEDQPDALLRRADRAMYQAKAAGRGRVVLA
ncbi:hypothetical protein C7S18_20430 [Ahniella affigens]|uniref:GGDEF domain-containing protein n=1 Tax=Ahniella affigens TaxID=2021234 RepID=A0A2P1PX27_9GAMM|nr:diguanylate cyclase [Ahniella affigens]AVP99392.1 hypothetical protein C7S18_20430 [Ahniella affigens]